MSDQRPLHRLRDIIFSLDQVPVSSMGADVVNSILNLARQQPPQHFDIMQANQEYGQTSLVQTLEFLFGPEEDYMDHDGFTDIEALIAIHPDQALAFERALMPYLAMSPVEFRLNGRRFPTASEVIEVDHLVRNEIRARIRRVLMDIETQREDGIELPEWAERAFIYFGGQASQEQLEPGPIPLYGLGDDFPDDEVEAEEAARHGPWVTYHRTPRAQRAPRIRRVRRQATQMRRRDHHRNPRGR